MKGIVSTIDYTRMCHLHQIVVDCEFPFKLINLEKDILKSDKNSVVK
jgi:hypothetical protein